MKIARLVVCLQFLATFPLQAQITDYQAGFVLGPPMTTARMGQISPSLPDATAAEVIGHPVVDNVRTQAHLLAQVDGTPTNPVLALYTLDIETGELVRSAGQTGPFTHIADATNMTYTLAPGDEGLWFQFEVTPRDTENNEGAPVRAVLEFSGGTGAADDPWLIASAAQLNRMSTYLGSAHADKHFRQVIDIDLGVSPWNDGTGWTPIGTAGNAFSGSFDGGGFTISNLTVNRPTTSYQGLFGYLSGAHVQRLRLENANVQGAQYTGGLAGYAVGGTIEFIEVTGEVNGGGDTGGLIGYTTSGCAVQAIDTEASVQGGDRTGGMIGYALGSTTINHACARGTVQGANSVGGLAGQIHQTILADSYSRADITGNNNVGGAVGYMAATSTSSTRAYIYRCYSTGAVIGNSGTGGLVGGVNYANNNIEAYSYWDEESSALTNSVRGTGHPTEAMQQQATFVNYNFYSVWSIDETNDYPVFQALADYAQPQPVTLDQLAGTGTPADPYLVTSLDELDAMRLDLTADYRLVTNLNAAATAAWDGGRGWTPIGTAGNAFSGSFDGGGFTISNLTANRPTTSYQGLFGYLSGAHVQRLRLENANVQGVQYTGGLAGYAMGGTIEFIEVTGEVNGGGDTGGLLGLATSGCAVQAIDVEASVQGGDRTGGVIGYTLGYSRVYHVSSRGTVQGANPVGGLAGQLYQAILADSYSWAAISGNNNVGGAVGYMAATSTSSTRAYIYRCYSTGAVVGNSGKGGLVGAINHVNNNIEAYSYWDNESSGLTNSVRGTGHPTEAMQQQATFVNYNFYSVWSIDETNDYPVFQALADYAQPQPVTLDQLAGTGTPADPYLVTSLDELDAMRLDLTADYLLVSNLNAAATAAWDGGRGWTPIGTAGNAFSGSFDGGGFTISNLTVNRPTTSYQGLFGYLSGAHVQRLRLENANVQGAQYTGGLAGYAVGGTIGFIEVTGEVNGGGDTGGLLGLATSGCAVQAIDVEASVQGVDRTGGVIGYTLGYSRVYHVSSRGTVQGANPVGGLAGQLYQAILADSYSWAAISGNNNVGGAIGYMAGSSSATRARAYRIYSSGVVSCGGVHGGLIGGSGSATYNTVGDGYWDTEASGVANSVYGSGQVTAAMYQEAAYTNFNFTTLWIIAATNTYPVFRDLGAYSMPQTVTLDQLSGAGTLADPYEVSSADELHAVRLGLTNHYRLVNDIDLIDTVIWDDGRGWTPIGSGSGVLSFQGSLDGNGHTISNMTVNRPAADYQGLFGYVANADIRNLNLGAVSVYGGQHVGGLAGYAGSATIESVEVHGAVKAQGSRVGLVMGLGSNVNLHRLHADGTVRGSDQVGGLVGWVSSAASTIYHSSARGSVEGNSHVGGLIGYLQGGLVADSYSRASVDGASNVGGLVGVSGYSIYGGSTDAYIYRAHCDGAVTGTASTVGGLLGAFVRGNVDDAYWDVDASGQTNSARGIGKTAADMQQQATYRFFNFNTLWQIEEDADTPVFRDLSVHALPDPVSLPTLQGDGTEASPYLIHNVDELAAMQTGLTNHFRLAKDIDASATVIWNGGRGWAPVGPDSGAVSFQGVLDGAGYTISNLTVNRPASNYQGLFGYLTSATVHDLGLPSANVSGNAHVGILAGMAVSSQAEAIETTGALNGYNSHVGGLIGWISNGHVHRGQAHVLVKGLDHVGGLVGRISSAASTLYHSSARGSVEGNSHVGGLIGYLQGGLVADSYSRASVDGASNVGGLVGVSGYSIYGGSTDAYIYRAHCDGAVTGTTSTVGGLLGAFVRGNVEDAYWDVDASGQTNSARGIGKTAADMQQQATYRFFNFNTLWQIEEDADTPVFRDLSVHALPDPVSLPTLQGDGTEASPYLIHNVDELAAMQTGLTNHFRLANDIDASATVIWNGGRGWAPVGPDSGAASFQGVLDGAGYAISNLTVNRPASNYQGLFGYLTSATVHDLGLPSANVSGNAYVGILAGMAVSSQAAVIETTGTLNGYNSHVGGLIGWISNGHVHRGHANALVKGLDHVGGLVGRVSSTASTLQRASSLGAVEGRSYIGGLIGYLQGGSVSDSYSRATVTADSNAGGLVGVSGYYISGGITYGHLDRTYSSGPVTGAGGTVGGLLGVFVRGSVTASYWDEEASGQTNSAQGVGRGTADMTYPRNTDTTYLGWDFVDVWSEDIATLNAGYPRLLDPSEHNLVYATGPGGSLSGPILQVVLSGQDGDPIEAVPDDGAEFDQWSDGRIDNPRTDTNVTASLSVTAHFNSVSLVPIEWYDGYGIERQQGETWADVDQRYDAAKRMTLLQQFVADLDPRNPDDIFEILTIDPGPPVTVTFRPGSTGRVYRFIVTDDLLPGAWTNVPGVTGRHGAGEGSARLDAIADPNDPPAGPFYRVEVALPE